ncbi:MAG: sugar phosphate nucleotidyltransferase [Acidobacteriota bacterium]
MVKALILAGGAASELLPLTIHTPKPLLPIGNYPLLLFQIYQFKKAGITDIILSLSYQPRKLREIFDDGSNFGVMLRYHMESTPVGTAGAFKVAENLIDDTTIVINGDVLTEVSYEELLSRHKKKKAQVTIGVSDVENPQAYGAVEINQSKEVTRFIERPRGKSVRTNTINAGIYILEPEVLKWIPQATPFFFEKDLFPILLEREIPIYAANVEQYWKEITRPDNYLQSNMDFLKKRVSIPHFVAFQRQHHPPKNPLVKVDELSVIDEQCITKPEVQIESSVIGSNCRIEEGAVIRNSVLWPGCRVQREAVISGSVLGRGCMIGEASRVRAGNILGDRSILAAHSRT